MKGSGLSRALHKKHIPQRGHKAQSAMEYLLTYGWALLIIATALVALFYLGIFNPQAPRVQPGTCRIYRSIAGASLTGQCQNIWPAYVARFDGVASYVSTGTKNLPVGNGARSMFAWINVPSTAATQAIFSYGSQNFYQESNLFVTSTGLEFSAFSDQFQSTLLPTTSAWHFVGYTYNPTSSTITIYMDGQSQSAVLGTALNTVIPATDPSDIGKSSNLQPCGTCRFFQGSMANVQVYNVTLTPNEVQSLYTGGIGGAPVYPMATVGWWPLNLNTQDYSGNNNWGTPTSLIYNNTWTNSYISP